MAEKELAEPAEEDVLWQVLRLAFPVVVEQSLILLVSFTDWWLTSQFLEGPDYKAAMALMGYLLWWFSSSFAFISIGASALTSRYIGAHDEASANRVAQQSLAIGLVLSVVLTIFLAIFGSSIIDLMQLQGRPGELTEEFLSIVLWSMPAIMFEQVGIACLQGSGDTISGFVARALVVLVNLVVSLSFVVGWGPFPELGWEGIALGTTTGHYVGGGLVLLMLLYGRSGLHIASVKFAFDWDLAWRILQIGIPAGIDVFIILTCHFTYLAIINRQGAQATAAHGLGVNIESLAYLPGSAFQVAASTLTGQYLGAKQPRTAMRAALTALVLGGGFMTLAGIGFYFFSEAFVGVFSSPKDAVTAEISAQLLKVVAWSMPSLATVLVLSGALRGAGDTRWLFVITLIGFVGVRIPFALWLACNEIEFPLIGITITGWGLGVFGAWYAMVADVILRSLLLTFRYWQGHWQEVEV